MAPNVRVAKAFLAMREIGIPEEKVKPVLKRLLGLYDKNWQLIEAENYRALADAIFEQEEQGQVKDQTETNEMADVEEQNRTKKRADIQDTEDVAQVNEEREQPLKKLRRSQEHQASPVVDNPSAKPNGTLLKQPKEEVVEVELPNETKLRSCSQRETESIRLNAEETSEDPHTLPCPTLVRRKGKQPMLCEPSSVVADKTLALAGNETKSGSVSPTTHCSEKEKELVPFQNSSCSDRRSPYAMCLKEPKVEPGISLSPKQQAKTSTVLTKSKEDLVTDDVPLFEISVAMIVPEPMVAEISSQLGDSVKIVSRPVQNGVRSDNPVVREISSLLGNSVKMPDCPDPLVSHPVQDGVRSDEPLDTGNSFLLGDSVRMPVCPEPLVSHPVQDGVRSEEPTDAEVSSLLGDSVKMANCPDPLVSHPVQNGVRRDEPMDMGNSSLLGYPVRLPDCPEPLVSHPIQEGVRSNEPTDAEDHSLLRDLVKIPDCPEPLVCHPVQDGVASDEVSSLLGDSVRMPDCPEPLVSHPVQNEVRSDEPVDAGNSFLLGDSVRMPDCPEPVISHPVKHGDRRDGVPASSKDDDSSYEYSGFTDLMYDENLSFLGDSDRTPDCPKHVSHPVQDGDRNDEPMDAETSFQLGDSVRMPDYPVLLVAHPVQDGVGSDGMPASTKDGGDYRETLTMETVNESPAINSPKQQSCGSDALDIADKTIGPDNGSYNSQNVNEVSQTFVPMEISSSNGNDCNKSVNDTDNHISGDDKDKELHGEHVNSHDLVLQQHQPIPLEGRILHDVIDITNGLEKVVISVINEVNDESPPSFNYIPQNVVFQNAYVNFSLARIGENCCGTCSGNCLSSPTPCACANETGGEYAYTPEGLVKEHILKESISMNRHPENHCQYYCTDCPLERLETDGEVEKCQGHLMRRFIKECWYKCGCDNQCGNRVVQRGISRKLQVFMTPEGKGWGLRTLEDLPEGAFVCEYVGEILTNAELSERVSKKSGGHVHSYPVLLDADWGAESVLKDDEALCLDATHYGNVARFVNHRCDDSNMVEIPVEVETPDHHYYHLAFFTTREVKALEELTWDYGINFDDKTHPVKAFKCRCGSKLCRNKKRPNRLRRIRFGGRRR